jgi:hypothetical protein
VWMVVPLAAEVVVGAFLASQNEPAGYTNKSTPVLTRNCRLLHLSVMKRRPVVVEQTCAAGDVCYGGFISLRWEQG